MGGIGVYSVCRRFGKSLISCLILTSVALGPNQASARIYKPTKADFVETKRYTTQGHSKSKGANLVMRYPASWLEKETEYPNLAHLLVSEDGLGMQIISILTKRIPGYDVISREEATEFLYGSPYDFLPRDAKFIGFEKTEINGEPAALIEYTMTRSFGGRKIASRVLSLNFFDKATWLNITYSVGDGEDFAEDVDITFENFRNLFYSLMATIVLPDKWN